MSCAPENLPGMNAVCWADQHMKSFRFEKKSLRSGHVVETKLLLSPCCLLLPAIQFNPRRQPIDSLVASVKDHPILIAESCCLIIN
jgi:hypothetical protein